MAQLTDQLRWIVLTAVAASAVGCAVEMDEDLDIRQVHQPSQCGTTWDGEGVEQLSGNLLVSSSYVAEHSRPVGRIGGCSGTLLEDNYFLTAAHCFSANNPPSSVRFNYQRSPGGGLRSSDYYSITQVVEHGNGGVDYAIVRLGGNPSADYPPARLADTRPPVGSTISIIGHPQGRPKEVATGHVYSYSSSRIRYADLDTLGGNSGSGVFDGTTGELIAVHTNGGCRQNGGSNSGWHIDRLLDVSPTLRAVLANSGGGGGGQQGDCDPGEVEYDDHCYAVTSTSTNQSNAQAQCESRGTGWGLAEVNSSAENGFLSSLAGGAELWLGGNDRSSEGTFEWESGAVFWTGGLSGGPVGGLYSNFISSEPNNGGGNSDCLRMISGGGWRDISCSSNYRALCESDLASPPPPPPAPTCNDGVQNGSETDVDCGGSTCGACSNGDSCNQDSDCASDNCSGGVCASAPPPPPPSGDFSGELVLRDEWEAGYCAEIVLENGGSSAVNGWTVRIDLNQASMGGSWNAQVSQSGGTVTATPAGWNANVPAGSTMTAWGYCASKTGNNWRPDLLSATAN